MSTTLQAGFEAIRDRLQCPRCGGGLALGAER
jgi:ribosomal protein S27AE